MHTPHLSRVQASLVALILGGACNDTWLLLSAGAISGAAAVAWLLAQCSNFPGMSRCSFCPTLVATFELSIRKNRRLLISKIYPRLTQMGTFYSLHLLYSFTTVSNQTIQNIFGCLGGGV